MKTTLFICLFAWLWLVCLPGHAQSADHNYILTRIPMDAAGSSFIDNIQYYDGMGRSSQLVQKGVTPSQGDMVSMIEYDEMGRESKRWIPTPFAADGKYVEDFTVQAPAKHDGDSNPYEEIYYQSSPMKRPLLVMGSGEEWAAAAAGVFTEYFANDNSVEELCAIYYKLDASKRLIKYGDYPDGSLSVIRVHDEDWNVFYTFTDKLKRKVLTRQVDRDGQMHDTYYVYDNLGRLYYVLPPMYAGGTNDLNKYAYQYTYDNLNRCISKKLPGADIIYYVYDYSDRLIVSQDGNQRPGKLWTVYRYDRFGRMINISEVKIGSSLATLRYTFEMSKLVESYSDQLVGEAPLQTGYTNKSLGTTTNMLTVNYYDNYNFMNNLPANMKEFLGYNAYISTPTHSNTRGMLTGKRVYRTDNPDEYITTAYYYDDKGRIVRTYSNNHLGGYDSHYYEYSFTGKMTRHNHIHLADGYPKLSQMYSYYYDHADRLLFSMHAVQNQVAKRLVYYTYDEKGRIANKSLLNNTENLAYDYNIRGWITSVKGSLYEEHLDYYPCYNGNIGSIRWRAGEETGMHKYTFTYDGLDRMKAAHYTEISDNISKPNGKYNLEIGGYDKNGNILQLSRIGLYSHISLDGKGTFKLIDNLSMRYDGNRLARVFDTSTQKPNYNGAMTFVDGADQEVEYTYDANGNMISDQNKGIEKITYNLMNMPSEVKFNKISTGPWVSSTTNRNIIWYGYDAEGKKHSATYITETEKILSGGQTVGSMQVNSSTTYCGNIIYENKVRSKILLPEGYINISGSNYNYYSYIDDYQGNHRVVFGNGKTVEEVNHYYPFGGLFGVVANKDTQKWKYGAKELERMNGLNWYDFSARQQDPLLGSFTSIDPLCEKYYSISPYAYCLNNPIRFVDPNGMDVYHFDLNTGRLVLKIPNENDFDEVIFTLVDSKGNTRVKKETIYKIEKGILSDGMEFMGKNNLIELGIKNGKPTLEGIQRFVIELAEIVKKELRGYELSNKGESKIRYVFLGKYNKNLAKDCRIRFDLYNKKPEMFGKISIRTDFHIHPSYPNVLDCDRIQPSSDDLRIKANTQENFPEVTKFIILTKGFEPLTY